MGRPAAEYRACPKCHKRTLRRNGHNGASPRWICRGPSPERTYCYGTRSPDSAVALGHVVGEARETTVIRDFINPRVEGAQTLIITSAQNATGVFTAGLKALKRYAKHLGAQLVVQPMRYANRTHLDKRKYDNDNWFDPSVIKYLHNQRTALNKNLVLLGDINAIPTAQDPLVGAEGFTGGMSCILGHPRATSRTVATPGAKMAKWMMTTGSITKMNYIPSKVGKAAEHHHIFGAIIVEIEGPLFWARRLNIDSRGQFIDAAAGLHVDPNGVRKASRPLGLICGDIHVAVSSPAVDAATFGSKGIVETLKPAKIVVHDLFDGQSVNPHEAKDPFVQAALDTTGRNDVEREVKSTIFWAKNRAPPRATMYVVASNHDDFLRRWVIDTDWKKLPIKNRSFYLKLAKVMQDGAHVTLDGFAHYPSPFPWMVEQSNMPNVRCLKLGDSLMIGKYECGYHGHKGPNGARGSLRNMRRLGVKTAIAHGHGPGESEGSVQVGHSSNEGGYTTGAPSSWMPTHGIIASNGKIQLVTIVGERYKR